MTDTYRIKALCWEQDGDIHSARALGCCYFCLGPFNGGRFKVKHVVDGISDWWAGSFDSLDAAKAACEKHWHDTIKQALEEV